MTSIVAKLPFASADPDPAFLLERKQGLEKYLQVSLIHLNIDSFVSTIELRISNVDCWYT